MDTELYRQLSARLDELSRRIDRMQDSLEAAREKTPWYRPNSASDLITLIGIPAALLAALWGFYDGVWLKLQRLDAATVSVAQERLSELQDLRSEIFVLQARENDAEIAAILEARAARRSRLVDESFAYWQEQRGYFSKQETILLAEELQLQGRQADALSVIDTVVPVGEIESADLARFAGSLYAARSPVQDMELARGHFQSALEHAAHVPSEAGKQQLWAKISFSWLYAEMSNGSACERTVPVAETLAELLADDPERYNLGVLDGGARELLTVNAERCDPVAGPR